MIEVKDLVKAYGDFKAVQGVSFRVEKGEILGFLGPNGAGKTTVMRILTCFLPATSGSATVADFDCETDSLEVRRRIGYLPENNPLYLEMRVSEYLDFAAQAKGIASSEREQAVARALAETGTEQVAGRLIAQLSKGFRQRVGLAQALLGNPEVLILDEPTVGLDPRQIAEIRDLIKSLAGRRTIILSTHILPEVSAVCDRVVIINKGRVIESDTTENLGRKVAKSSKFQVEIGGEADEIQGFLAKMDKVIKVSRKESLAEAPVFEIETGKDVDIRAAVSAAVVQKGWALHEIKYVGVELEDTFIRLTEDARQDTVEEDVPEEEAAPQEVTS